MYAIRSYYGIVPRRKGRREDRILAEETRKRGDATDGQRSDQHDGVDVLHLWS